MSESRYKEAYNKGVEDGKKIKANELGYQCSDEAYTTGYKDALKEVIDEMVETYGEFKGREDFDDFFKWLVRKYE